MIYLSSENLGCSVVNGHIVLYMYIMCREAGFGIWFRLL